MIGRTKTLALSLLLSLVLGGCAWSKPASSQNQKLQVIATTSIIGDVVQNVGGDYIDVNVLLTAGADPHSFEPTPRQLAAMNDADVIFVNGLGLEEALQPLLESIQADGKRVVDLSVGVDVMTLASAARTDHVGEGEESGGVDPHVWLDPTNVMVWVDHIADVLSELDPAHTESYRTNAQLYRAKLAKLDDWIRAQFVHIPPSKRKIVTDHAVFNYFARQYGFQQVGAIVAGFSTLASPSAQELAALEDAIRKEGVRAILVGNTINPALSKRIAKDTGVRLISVYTGSLSEADGPASTYIDYMRYNAQAILQALQ